MKSILYLYLLLLISSCQPTEIDDYMGDAAMNIMSFNLRYDESADEENQWNNRKEAVLTMLNELQPLVIGIQEGLHHQVTYLDENLPAYQYVGVGRDDGETAGEYAAILYDTNHFELLENGDFWLSETPETASLGWDANNIRICTWAKLKDIAADQILYVFNTHFDHKGKIAQEQSSELIVQKVQEIAASDVPVFITGDFNLLIGSKRLEPITEQYAAAHQTAEISDNNKSFNAWGRGIRSRNIDFIFYQHAKPIAYKTIVKDYSVPYISDHYPIFAHFDYQ